MACSTIQNGRAMDGWSIHNLKVPSYIYHNNWWELQGIYIISCHLQYIKYSLLNYVYNLTCSVEMKPKRRFNLDFGTLKTKYLFLQVWLTLKNKNHWVCFLRLSSSANYFQKTDHGYKYSGRGLLIPSV